jgi:hypothetical protein
MMQRGSPSRKMRAELYVYEDPPVASARTESTINGYDWREITTDNTR